MLAKNWFIHKRTLVSSCLYSILMSLWFNCSKRCTFFLYSRKLEVKEQKGSPKRGDIQVGI